MKLSEFFSNAGTKKIVINTDIDGFLSGMILQEYYGCEIVGFSNSKESIWLTPDVKSIKEPVYIDIFINEPQTYCIDQHIVAYDNAHLNRLLAYGTKLNPNLNISKRTYSGDLGSSSDYYHKYPFGTVHYLIALMKLDGIDVKFNELGQTKNVYGSDFVNYNVCPAQLILRADDALYSSLGPYSHNTNIWWEYLRKFKSNTIEALIEYKNKCDVSKNYEYKSYLAKFFCNGLGCDGKDGAFDNITYHTNRKLQGRVIHYCDVISDIMGIGISLPKELTEYKGIANRANYTENRLNNSFTYAFVCSPSRPNTCFSYTMDIH